MQINYLPSRGNQEDPACQQQKPFAARLAGPLPELGFCPTGGVGPDNFRDYLALENVRCVGGSWICPESLVREQRWAEITRLAEAAIALARAEN